jgi:hypothetical protein
MLSKSGNSVLNGRTSTRKAILLLPLGRRRKPKPSVTLPTITLSHCPFSRLRSDAFKDRGFLHETEMGKENLVVVLHAIDHAGDTLVMDGLAGPVPAANSSCR